VTAASTLLAIVLAIAGLAIPPLATALAISAIGHVHSRKQGLAMASERVSNPRSMAFPHGVPDGQTVHAVVRPRVQRSVGLAIVEAVQWSMLPAALYLIVASVLRAGQLASADLLVAAGLASVVGVLAYVMSRRRR
jgi:hypothetical protein